LAEADEVERPRLRGRAGRPAHHGALLKLGEVADEFEKIHNIERALAVGSVHAMHQ
jgi:hypothetical protein